MQRIYAMIKTRSIPKSFEKKCSICGEKKDLDDFPFMGGLYCSECNKVCRNIAQLLVSLTGQSDNWRSFREKHDNSKNAYKLIMSKFYEILENE